MLCRIWSADLLLLGKRLQYIHGRTKLWAGFRFAIISWILEVIIIATFCETSIPDRHLNPERHSLLQAEPLRFLECSTSFLYILPLWCFISIFYLPHPPFNHPLLSFLRNINGALFTFHYLNSHAFWHISSLRLLWAVRKALKHVVEFEIWSTKRLKAKSANTQIKRRLITSIDMDQKLTTFTLGNIISTCQGTALRVESMLHSKVFFSTVTRIVT